MSWLPKSASCSLGAGGPKPPKLEYPKMEPCDTKSGPGLGAAGMLFLCVASVKVGISAVALPPYDMTWRVISCSPCNMVTSRQTPVKGTPVCRVRH